VSRLRAQARRTIAAVAAAAAAAAAATAATAAAAAARREESGEPVFARAEESARWVPFHGKRLTAVSARGSTVT